MTAKPILSEEELIGWIQGRPWPRNEFVVRGIGDDCAVCRPSPGCDLVVTTDLLVEGRHFRLDTTSAGDLGWKTGAANLSDIAAMGARPVAFLLAAAFPGGAQEVFREIMAGLAAVLDRYGTPLAGGDLSAADRIFLSATVIGEVPAGGALTRSGARPGDAVFLTGEPGYAGAGLRQLTAGYRQRDGEVVTDPAGRPVGPEVALVRECVRKHLRPEPRLEAGEFLRLSGAATAAIDTSDGLAKDLRQICIQSGAGAEIFESFLTLLAQGDIVTVEDVLSGGEDYELLCTIDPAREAEFLAEWRRKPGLPDLHRLGRICAEHPGRVVLQGPEGERPLRVDGFDHFREGGAR